MKIAIYSPYLDTFGGGEKYMMTIAEILSSGNNVDVFLDHHLADLGGDYLKNELSNRFNLNLKSINFINAPVGKNSSAFFRFFFLKKYDLLIYLTDGSVFVPLSKKNILHIQSPLIGQPAQNWWGKLKLNCWDLIIYNSKFTRNASLKNWPIKSEVIYPPVDIGKIKPLKKKKYILSVGRFFGYLEEKKHQDLIKAFGKLWTNEKIKDWSLHLVGSAGEGDKNYLEKLRKLAKGLPIKFYPNLSYDNLIRLYGESSIYWHAAGFNEKDPIKMEHFGISTVEAMAGGCVPVVIGNGGQIEIVKHSKSGFLWEDVENLIKFTFKLICDDNIRNQMAKQARKRSENFSKQKFKERIIQTINI